MSTPVVCIDGPNGVGKTAVARCLAGKLGWRWLSVGTVYRALAAADASLDASLRLLVHPAPDGTLDPVVEVNGARVTERDVIGAELGHSAAMIAHVREWQDKVNQELKRYAEGGLVVEGRATQEIFPGATLHVYLWADSAERSRRTAAVTGASHDPGRDRDDAARALEALRLRPGAIVWNSSRYALEDTVAGLARRMQIASGAEPAVVGVWGAPPSAVDRRPVPFRLVNAAAGEEPVDALLWVPSELPAGRLDALVAAHLRVLLAGNDLLSIGEVRGGGEPAATQRMLEAALWPLQRWLRADWLVRHGHFAVTADVLALAAASLADLGTLAERQAARATPAQALLDALQGCRWIPNPDAVMSCQVAGPVPPPRRQDLGNLLASLSDRTSAGSRRLDLRDYADNLVPLWVLSAAPDQVLDVALSWDKGRKGSVP